MVAVIGLLFAVSVRSFANIRAPIYQDNHFSGSAIAASQPAGVYLTGENMKVEFPELREGAYTGKAEFTVVYQLSNANRTQTTLKVSFLAINAVRPAVGLNGTGLYVTMGRNPVIAKEFVVKLSEHRLSWNTNFYRHFLDRSAYAMNYINENGYPTPNPNWLNELRNMNANDRRLNEFFFETYAQFLTNDFGEFSFEVKLEPGVNKLEVKYTQVLFMNERAGGYGAAKLTDSMIGFDYPLYPALSWRLSPDFNFDVEVIVPDFRKQGLFFMRYFKQRIYSSLDLVDQYDARSRIHRYRAEFPGYPRDIFTFLVEVDR
jgi:hypothetical protein